MGLLVKQTVKKIVKQTVKSPVDASDKAGSPQFLILALKASRLKWDFLSGCLEQMQGGNHKLVNF